MAGLSKVGNEFGLLAWTTPSGSLGSFNAGDSVNETLITVNNGPYTTRYKLLTGSLPPGLTLSKDGVISGTITGSSATYNFTVLAKSPVVGQVSQDFEITLNAAPVWTTPSGNILTIFDGDPVPGGTQVVATGPEVGDTITYTLAPGSGPLPSGVTLNTDGTFTGTVTEDVGVSTDFNFTVRATDQASAFTDRSFFITVEDDDAPVWTTTSPLTNISVGGTPSAVVASDPDSLSLTYTLESGTLPPGLTLNNDGTFSGTASTAGNYTFTVRATDQSSNFTDRTFDITVDP